MSTHRLLPRISALAFVVAAAAAFGITAPSASAGAKVSIPSIADSANPPKPPPLKPRCNCKCTNGKIQCNYSDCAQHGMSCSFE